MTDADKLHELAFILEQGDYKGSSIPAMLRRIADLLDAVPPETLKALAAGTWKAVPVEPTENPMPVWRRRPKPEG